MNITKAILAVTAITTITGCSKPAQKEESTSNPDYKVELLFIHDGVKVYSFYTGNRTVYYTDARGKTQTTYSNGKTTTTQDVETVD